MGKKTDAKIQRILSLLPATKPQLQERFPMGEATAWRWMERLHAEERVYISGWVRAEFEGERVGKRVPIYSAGPGQDVQCNIRIPSKSTRDKRRRDQRNAAARARYWLRQLDEGKLTLDPLMQTWLNRLPETHE